MHSTEVLLVLPAAAIATAIALVVIGAGYRLNKKQIATGEPQGSWLIFGSIAFMFAAYYIGQSNVFVFQVVNCLLGGLVGGAIVCFAWRLLVAVRQWRHRE